MDRTKEYKNNGVNDSEVQPDALSGKLSGDHNLQNKNTVKKDPKALFRIGYGLYVITCNDGKKDNGMIVNTVMQVTNSPDRIAVCINKGSFSHQVIKKTGLMNVNCLSENTPFSVFKSFGFRSGRNTDKFEGAEVFRSDNGLAVIHEYANACISLIVEQYVDLGTHGMFVCSVEAATVLSDSETMTYTFYQEKVKPQSQQTDGKKGFVCRICGYVYDGDELPEDFICPLCKHGAEDFEPVQ